MLHYKLTKYHTGIELWGDPWALRVLRALVHRLCHESPIIYDKEGAVVALAYDLRKAYEGQRLRAQREHLDDTCTIHGVQILWPVIAIQVGLLRASMAFVPHGRGDQALMYELESVVEAAIKELLPAKCDEVMSEIARIGAAQGKHIESVLNSRCLYFLSLQPAKRKAALLPLLASMDPMYGVVAGNRAMGKPFTGIAPTEFATFAHDEAEWPEFKW